MNNQPKPSIENQPAVQAELQHEILSDPRPSSFASQAMICVAALMGMLILTLAFFFGSDYFSAASAESIVAASPDDYPHLSKDLPQRVQLALTNGNAETPSGLALFFDDKLSPNQGKTNSPAGATELVINKPNPATTVPRISLPIKPEANFPPTGGYGQTMPPNNVPPVPAVETEDSQVRLERRQNNIRRGETVESLAQVYNIEDVEPIGVVGDSKKREVLFYSPTTKQTFAAPLGTKFRDGTLEDADVKDNILTGLNFRRDDNGQKLTREIGTIPKSKKKNSVEQPLLTDENVMTPTRQNPQVVKRDQ